MMSLHVSLDAARTVTTPAATMRTLTSPTASPPMPVAVWRTELAAGSSGPRHVINGDHFVVVLGGTLHVEIDGRTHDVVAGDGIKLPAGCTRVIGATDDGPAVTLTVGEPDARASVGSGDPVPVPWTA
jgi:quercetin dioxygenase-like cupin family protein